MAELEDKAGRAWALMFSWAMPAGIALDFVQEVTDDRPKALAAILTEAVAQTGNARPSVKQDRGSFPDFEAGKIGAAVLRGDSAFAFTILANLKARLHQQERNPTTELAGIAEWLEWCTDMGRAILLCRELVELVHPAS